MPVKSIFADPEDVKEIIEEEQNLFVKFVLENIGIPLETYWPDISLTVEEKVKLRKLLSDKEIDIEIISDGDYGTKIYQEDNLIAEMEKPRTIMREDLSVRNPKKRFYYEIEISYRSVYDKEGE